MSNRRGHGTKALRKTSYPSNLLNFLTPEKANQSFKRANTDLLNGINVSTYDPREIRRFKRTTYRTLLERATKVWQKSIFKRRHRPIRTC